MKIDYSIISIYLLMSNIHVSLILIILKLDTLKKKITVGLYMILYNLFILSINFDSGLNSCFVYECIMKKLYD